MLSDDVFRLVFTEYEGVFILGNLEILIKNILLLGPAPSRRYYAYVVPQIDNYNY